jgi:phosphonopyruvate decarboxylase
MINAGDFIEAAGEHGFGLYSGVPCSYLTPFINRVIDDRALRYIGATNEGDAVAIASGAELAGQRAVAMFQNSGLGNAVSPLTSLNYVFRIPVLLIATHRGEPGGEADAAQHALMGAITTELLDLMRIPWEPFPAEAGEIGAVLERAVRYMDKERRPYALVMSKGSVSPSRLRSAAEVRPLPEPVRQPVLEASHSRRDMLHAIQAALGPDDLVVATTGYTGRELYNCADLPNQFYMVGSMGCAASLGLGLACTRPERRVFVIDGDGAAMMRMGSMATVGYERPANLTHVLLDNQVHESTGAQSTVSHSLDFCGIAAACGYPLVERVATPEALGERLRDARSSLGFVHVPILRGTGSQLQRPTATPEQNAERLRRFCRAA